MIEPRRLLMLAAALNLTVCLGSATAQTVILRNAAPDSAVEVVLNDTPVGTGKANEKGDVLVTVGLSEHAMKTETDAQIFVDACPACTACADHRAGSAGARPGRRVHAP